MMFQHLFVHIDALELTDARIADIVGLAKAQNARITAGVSDPLLTMPATAYQADVLAMCPDYSARPGQHQSDRAMRFEEAAVTAGVKLTLVRIPHRYVHHDWWSEAMKLGCDFAVLPHASVQFSRPITSVLGSLALIKTSLWGQVQQAFKT